MHHSRLQLLSYFNLQATDNRSSQVLHDCINTKHPHLDDSSENPPSSSRTLQKRTPFTKGTEESSSSSKSTLNLNFFFFIIIKSIHWFSTLEKMLKSRPSLTLQPHCVGVLVVLWEEDVEAAGDNRLCDTNEAEEKSYFLGRFSK